MSLKHKYYVSVQVTHWAIDFYADDKMFFEQELYMLREQIERAQDIDELNYLRAINEKKYWWTSIFVAGLFYALDGNVGKMILTWILSFFTLGIYALYVIYTSYRDQNEFNNQMEYYILQRTKELRGNPQGTSSGASYGSENTFDCPNCGYQLSESHKFCPNCGNKVEIPKRVSFCSNCGVRIMDDAMFCHECGNALYDEEEEETVEIPQEETAETLQEETLELEASEVIQLPAGDIEEQSD